MTLSSAVVGAGVGVGLGVGSGGGVEGEVGVGVGIGLGVGAGLVQLVSMAKLIIKIQIIVRKSPLESR